ncbi:MAG: zinc-binding dehydrogenase [Chloroflexi bacterium]|nr:zinc-binding dehydrogenase [Chloroflexota bacterium]MDA1228501.1 zinc-binding dehydrogenase [Chloroflexota bacterium]
MKAVYLTEHGGVDVLTYGDLPEPQIGPNEVKIRVRACALNRLDLYTRAGARGTRIRFNGPHVLGGDVSGEIAEIGSQVTRVAVGDRVVVNPRITCNQCRFCVAGEEEFCSSAGMLGASVNGGYAEYVSVPAVNAFPIPDSLSFEQAASLPTVFMPCWTILMRKAQLKPWETVLIPSASSGVGTAAIQVAKKVIGSTVITTTSTEEKAQKARELGADHVINYNTEDIAKRVKEITGGQGVNVVLDHVGSDFWPAATASLAMGGRYGICGVTSGYKAELQMGLMFLRYQTVFGVFMGRKEDLRQIVELAGRGTIQGVIHETFPLQDAAKAHEAMEAVNFFGKLVLTVD